MKLYNRLLFCVNAIEFQWPKTKQHTEPLFKLIRTNELQYTLISICISNDRTNQPNSGGKCLNSVNLYW